MPTYPADYFPRYSPGYKEVTTGYHKTINTRVRVRYPKWGFVIYRGTYSDDALWEKCVVLLKSSVDYWLRERNQADVLGPDLVWTIIEDRDTLDGAPKEAVRARFREWAACRSVERDGPGADGRWVCKESPRFRFCVYVDQASLDSLTARWIPRENYWSLEGQVAIINGTHGHHDEDIWSLEGQIDEDIWNREGRQVPIIDRTHGHHDENFRSGVPTPRPKEKDEDEESEDEEEVYPPIEGNTSQDVGWRYVDAGLLTTWYEALHIQGMEWETWYYFYKGKRPYGPEVLAGSRGEPLIIADLLRNE